MRNTTLRALNVERVPEAPIHAPLGDSPLCKALQRQKNSHPRFNDIVPKYQFLKELEREKRRSDRSKAPLSIVMFRLDGSKHSEPSNVTNLLQLLSNHMRETDILGCLAKDLIALLLLDTNEQGTNRFVDKTLNQTNSSGVSTMVATYPDQLFDGLITEHDDLQDPQVLLIDGATGRYRSVYPLKRCLDIVGALVGILVLSPLMLVTAIAIALTSPGPIIFKQIRIGRGGVPFVFYKFRSMVCNVDDRIHREYVAKLINENLGEINQGSSDNPMYKIKSDPRVTRIGRIIRKTSIDELPQFLNVLKGDMSLVGPRPPLPYETEEYQSWHLRRLLEIKPGITGLWQVEGRSKTSFNDMVRMDIRYIKYCSLKLDLKILLKTVKVVLRCDGAN